MFKVKSKETGAVHTVYGRNGLMFLLYDEDAKQWVFKHMEEFEPYIEELENRPVPINIDSRQFTLAMYGGVDNA